MHRIARASRTGLLWLALALAAAHSIAVWHAFSQNHLDARPLAGGKQLAHGQHCDLCVVAAGIGGPATAGSGIALRQFGQATPSLQRPSPQPEAMPSRPYAIRAPPAANS